MEMDDWLEVPSPMEAAVEPLVESTNSTDAEKVNGDVELYFDSATVTREDDLSGATAISETAGGLGLASMMVLPTTFVTGVLSSLQWHTGLPWWVTIVGATVGMRLCLFPLTLLQIHKSSQFMSAWPKMALQSDPGRTWARAYHDFSTKRKDVGAPSPAWLVLAPAIQIPLFLTWVMAIRGMALGHFPGFEIGGMLWFTDLTAVGSGSLRYILPTLTATTYLANMHVALRGVQVKAPGPTLGFHVYRTFLEGLAIPSFAAGLYLPQAVFMYWITNNIFSICQGLALQNPRARRALGLPAGAPSPRGGGTRPEGSSLAVSASSQDQAPSYSPEIALRNKELLAKMSADQLVEVAAQCEANADTDSAIVILRQALGRDKHHGVALYALGKLLAKKQQWRGSSDAFLAASSERKGDAERGAALFGAGISLAMQAGHDEEAVRALREAAALRPGHVKTLLALASLSKKLGDQEGAREAVKRAGELQPELADLYAKGYINPKHLS